MRTSGTLSRYIGRQFLFYFCMLLGILLSVILLIDTVELLRRRGERLRGLTPS